VCVCVFTKPTVIAATSRALLQPPPPLQAGGPGISIEYHQRAREQLAARRNDPHKLSKHPPSFFGRVWPTFHQATTRKKTN
jgi:hypothetical protein